MEKQMYLNIGNPKTNEKFNKLKDYNGNSYSGMNIGGAHKWNYNNGIWVEKKLTPDKWEIDFRSIKTRSHAAPANTGAKIGSGFHWYIIADQKAYKSSSNSYDTIMRGLKFKVGHKRPNWRNWSYDYPEQDSYKNHIINILEDILAKLKAS